MAYVAESGHWYDRNGNSAYTVIGSNGKERNTTLRDARKLDLVPSVTTVMKVAAAPGLERWKQEQVLLAALTLPRDENESEKEWMDRVMMDSRESGRKAADLGTDIHASIQQYYEQSIINQEHMLHVEAVEKALDQYFGIQKWVCEKSFAHRLGFGGKVDMHTDNIVVDIKTKDFGPDDKITGFDEHLMQLAAYRMGLDMPTARCANIFVSRSHPGVVSIYEWEDVDKGWLMFRSLLEFWQTKNEYQ